MTTSTLAPNFTFVVADSNVTNNEIAPARSKRIGEERISDLIARNALYDAKKRDITTRPSQIQLRPEGGFSIDGQGSFTMEPHALRQAAQRLGLPFFESALSAKDTEAYISRFPQHFSPIWQSLSEGYEATGKGNREVLARTYNETSVRAYMSDKFTAINNADMLGILQDYLDTANKGQYKLVRPFVGRDGMTVDVIFPNDGGGYSFKPQNDNGDGSGYGFGVRIQTGEIGNISARVAPLLQRHSCTNSIVATDKGITVKQNGNKDVKLQLLITAIGDTLNANVEMINRMISARNMKLPQIASIISKMVEKEGWGEEVQMKLSYGTENHESFWGLINGITYAAHAAEMPAEQSIEMEQFAGAMLFDPNLLRPYVTVER